MYNKEIKLELVLLTSSCSVVTCDAAVAGPVVIWPLQTLRMQHSPALQALQTRGDAALGSDSGHNVELSSNTGPMNQMDHTCNNGLDIISAHFMDTHGS